MSAADVRAYYDDFASTYDVGRDRGYHALVDEIEASVVIPHARGRSVLEVGCGTGLVLAKLARVAREAVGVDLSPGMLAIARGRGLDVREGSATALPFDDGAFDVVCSFKVLAHVPDIDQALREIARVLRPGGTAVLEFYNRRSLRYLGRLAAGARAIGGAHREDDVPTRWDTAQTARRRLPATLRQTGLVGVRIVTPAAFLHRAPLLGTGLAMVERALARGPFAKFGGFLVVIAKRD